MKKLLVTIFVLIFGLVFLGFSPAFAGDRDIEDLYKRIEGLEEKVKKQEEKTDKDHQAPGLCKVSR